MPPWEPEVEQRAHPFGEAGVRSSLEEVCRRAAQGASEVLGNPKHLARVRTWSIDQLHRAKEKGEVVVTGGDRARVLLEAVQQKKLWTPDPIGIEYIPAAHLMACEGDKHEDGTPCVKGDDCDGVVVFLAACFMSVGLYTMIVGHSYSKNGVIGHVLTKVYFNRKWHYADPSPLADGKYLPIGRSAPFTRERYYSMPTIKVVCDAENCDIRKFDPDALGFVEQGTFVGVNGIAVEELPPEMSVRWLGQVEWIEDHKWLGEGSDDAMKSATADCAKAAKGFDLDTKTGRESAFKNTAKCTAEAACAIYGKGMIPPGTCSTIAGPLVDGAVNIWNSVFGDNEEAEKARIRDANTAKYFQTLDKLLVMDAAWSAYSQNTMTRLIKFHDQNLPSKTGAWGGGALTKRKITHADITKPGIPTEYQTWDVETYANPCPVFTKLVKMGNLPAKEPPDSQAALCNGRSVNTLFYELMSWQEKNPGKTTVEKTAYANSLVQKVLPSWFKLLDEGASKLQNSVVVEKTRLQVDPSVSSDAGSGPKANSGVKTVATATGVVGAAWLAWKYLLPILTGGKA